MKVIHRDQILLLSHVPTFMIPVMVKIGKHAPLLTHPPNLQSIGQSQDIEATTDLTQNDNSEQIFEPSTDTETTCEPLTQTPLRQSNTPATLEINDPTTKNIPQNVPSHSRGGRYNLSHNPNPNYSDIYRY